MALPALKTGSQQPKENVLGSSLGALSCASCPSRKQTLPAASAVGCLWVPGDPFPLLEMLCIALLAHSSSHPRVLGRQGLITIGWLSLAQPGLLRPGATAPGSSGLPGGR